MKKRQNRRRIGTKMKYELRVADLSEKYFGDLIPKERMEHLQKEKYGRNIMQYRSKTV